MSIRVITNTKEFEEYELGWKLLDKYCNLFMLKDWLLSWWKSCEKDNQLRIYIAEKDDGTPEAILPLMKQTKDGYSIIRQLAAGGADFYGIICESTNNNAAVEIFKYIAESEVYDRFEISNLRTDDPGTEMMIKAAFDVFNDVGILIQGKVFCIDTTSNYDDYYKSRTKNFRHRFNRIIRKENKYTFEAVEKYSDELLATLEDLHKRRWREDMQLSYF